MTEPLIAEVGITLTRLTRELAKAEARMVKTANKTEQSFNKSTSRSARSFRKIDAAAKRTERNVGKSFRTLGRLGAVVGTGLSVRAVTNYADAWTLAGNKIKAASQVSGIQSRSLSEINDLATKSRSGLEQTVDLYSRILRVSGPLKKSEEEVALVTELSAKAFKAGGAAAQEQAAGILQLGQALGSGFLQGDELRSIRENAPLIAQAIADEFETTIGGLKKLGAEGELVSDRVFAAIINGQAKIQRAFAVTDATVGEGFILARNAMIELVGAFDDGAKASEVIGGKVAGVTEYLNSSVAGAKRFGAQMSEAFTIVGEAIDIVSKKVDGSLGPEILDAARNSFTGLMLLIRDVMSLLFGTGAAVAAAMINSVDAVANGSVAIANAAVTAVESILNGIIGGVQKAVQAINNLITKSNSINPFKDIPTLTVPLKIELERFSGGDTSNNKTVTEAFKAGQRAAKTQIDGIFRRVSRAGESPNDDFDPRGNQLQQPTGASGGLGSVPNSGGSGGKSNKKSKDQVAEFFKNIEAQKQALRDEIDLIGLSENAVTRLKAKQELLAAAKKKGLDLDKRTAETGQTLREEIDAQADAIANLTEKAEQYREQAYFVDDINEKMKDGFLDSIVAGESLSGVFQDLARSIAKASLEALIFGSGPLAGSGGGGGLLGGLLGGADGGIIGKLLSFDGGGYTGGGSRSGGLDGRGGFPALLHPNETVIDHTKAGSGGGGTSTVRIILGEGLESQIIETAVGQSVEIIAAGAAEKDRRNNEMGRRK
jgi:tape measure domain-containing protein